MEKEFKRGLPVLDEVFGFVEDFIAANNIKDEIAFPVKLAVEELFTNLVRHNSGGRDRILLSLDREPSRLIIKLRDSDVEPFDVTKAGTVDIQQSLSERKIGGLGIHLVRSVVDKLTYEYRDRTLCVTAIKNLEEEDV